MNLLEKLKKDPKKGFFTIEGSDGKGFTNRNACETSEEAAELMDEFLRSELEEREEKAEKYIDMWEEDDPKSKKLVSEIHNIWTQIRHNNNSNPSGGMEFDGGSFLLCYKWDSLKDFLKSYPGEPIEYSSY